MADAITEAPPPATEIEFLAAKKANEDLGDVMDGDVHRLSTLDKGTSLLTTHEAAQESIRDGLTGLFNRRHLDETFKQLNPNKKGSVLMLDIDGFKKFNDTYGHSVGDQMLVSIARALQNNVGIVGNGDKDKVFRYGGEELLVFFEGLDDPTVLKRRAEELRQEIKRSFIMHNNQVLQTTVSVGVTVHKLGEQFEKTTERADQAMYNSKHTGKDKVTLQ